MSSDCQNVVATALAGVAVGVVTNVHVNMNVTAWSPATASEKRRCTLMESLPLSEDGFGRRITDMKVIFESSGSVKSHTRQTFIIFAALQYACLLILSLPVFITYSGRMNGLDGWFEPEIIIVLGRYSVHWQCS